MKNGVLYSLVLSFIFVQLAPAQAVDGSGTTNRIPLWISPSTIGDSKLFQTGGKVGVGTTSPAATLDVIGVNGTDNVSGGNAPLSFEVIGGAGARNNFGLGVQGAGGSIQVISGKGKNLVGTMATGGTGAAILITGGGGAICGPASFGCGKSTGGNGGSVTLQPGGGGFPLGKSGNIILAPSGGKVGIGTASPSVKLHVIGNFIATGTKSALVETYSYGKRQLYAVESPENWFEDFGSAQLVRGRAIVTLDPIFAETVSTSNEYYVFLTPKGDCDGLYISTQSPKSFEVRELRHGSKTIIFDYRVVAKRKGYERTRLAQADEPAMPSITQ